MISRTDANRAVERRADGRCEYCRMHQSLQGATFHIEPIVPISRGGSSELDNLAWCCPSCNLSKSDRIESVDPDSGATLPLFNPRADSWDDHFRWEWFTLVGKTAVGRATAIALNVNQPRRVLIRQAEQLFDLFPP
jgi:HNH endonuclease